MFVNVLLIMCVCVGMKCTLHMFKCSNERGWRGFYVWCDNEHDFCIVHLVIQCHVLYVRGELTLTASDNRPHPEHWYWFFPFGKIKKNKKTKRNKEEFESNLITDWNCFPDTIISQINTTVIKKYNIINTHNNNHQHTHTIKKHTHKNTQQRLHPWLLV